MTRDQILAQIRSQTLVEDTNVSDADIVILINQGMNEIEAAYQGWPFLADVDILGVSASDHTVAVGADFSYGMKLIDTVEEMPIVYVSPSAWFSLYEGKQDDEGDPRVFTIWDGNILLYPTPDATDNDRLNLYFYTTITELSSGSSTPTFHKAFHWALVEYGKWRLYEREEYYEESERARLSFITYINQMVTYYQNQMKRELMIFGDGARDHRWQDNIPWLWVI